MNSKVGICIVAALTVPSAAALLMRTSSQSAAKISVTIPAGRPPDGPAQYQIRVKESSPNLICKSIIVDTRLYLQIIVPRDADRWLVISTPHGHWVSLDDSYYPDSKFPKGVTLELDPETQKGYEYVWNSFEPRRVTLFKESGKYQIFLWKTLQEVDWCSPSAPLSQI